MSEEDKKRLGELIIQLAQGNILVLDEIAKLVERILMSVGNFYYRNRADVEDAIHDLYMVLPRKASYFKVNVNSCAWIVKIFQNSIKSNLRQLKREKKYLEQEVCCLKSDVNKADERFIENYLYLQDVCNKLTKEEKDIVVYYYWCGCTVRETAKLLRMPRSTLFNKLKKLEETVKNLYNDWDKSPSLSVI